MAFANGSKGRIRWLDRARRPSYKFASSEPPVRSGLACIYPALVEVPRRGDALRARPPGDKLFVDYAGLTIPITDRHAGEVTPAQLLVAVLGHSCYTYVKVAAPQQAPDWIASHMRALEFFGGVTSHHNEAGISRHIRAAKW